MFTTDFFAFFLIVALSILIGNVKIGNLSLGSSATILVAMVYGFVLDWRGDPLDFPKVVQDLGLVLFLFTIGVQAGPSFFDALRKEGTKIIILGVTIVLTATASTIAVGYLMGVDWGLAAGLMAGALTSSPGLAAAVEASPTPLPPIGYGIAYPFGVIGVIMFVRIAPKIFRIDIAAQEEEYTNNASSLAPPLRNQNFIITNDNIDGKTIRELDIVQMTGANISRVMHPNQESSPPAPDTVLRKGDLVKAVGTVEALRRVEILLGHPTEEKIPVSGQYEIRWYILSKKEIVGKTLGELNLNENYRAAVTRVRRNEVDLEPRPTTRLRFGDKLYISASKGNIDGLTRLLGNSVKDVETMSFLPISLGIVIGVLIGKIGFPLPGGGTFSLGLSGGVLLTAIIVSYLGRTGPIIWNIPGNANTLLRQLGLLLFLIPVGVSAGSSLGDTVAQYGIILLLGGVVVTLLPMIVGTLVGVMLLKMNFLTILGTLTGGMTSTPGLGAAEATTKTDAPAVAYATVYPFALVVKIICLKIIAGL